MSVRLSESGDGLTGTTGRGLGRLAARGEEMAFCGGIARLTRPIPSSHPTADPISCSSLFPSFRSADFVPSFPMPFPPRGAVEAARQTEGDQQIPAEDCLEESLALRLSEDTTFC